MTKRDFYLSMAGLAACVAIVVLLSSPIGRYIAAMIGGSIQYGHL